MSGSGVLEEVGWRLPLALGSQKKRRANSLSPEREGGSGALALALGNRFPSVPRRAGDPGGPAGAGMLGKQREPQQAAAPPLGRAPPGESGPAQLSAQTETQTPKNLKRTFKKIIFLSLLINRLLGEK